LLHAALRFDAGAYRKTLPTIWGRGTRNDPCTGQPGFSGLLVFQSLISSRVIQHRRRFLALRAFLAPLLVLIFLFGALFLLTLLALLLFGALFLLTLLALLLFGALFLLTLLARLLFGALFLLTLLARLLFGALFPLALLAFLFSALLLLALLPFLCGALLLAAFPFLPFPQEPFALQTLAFLGVGPMLGFQTPGAFRFVTPVVIVPFVIVINVVAIVVMAVRGGTAARNEHERCKQGQGENGVAFLQGHFFRDPPAKR
jgi:hypothetical protein